MITLTLTEQELQALVAIIDAGQKALGLQASRACAILQDKIDAAAKAAQPEEKEAA
jgi:ABC-type siderophore export system fused ATPase/permease subunit